jgi:xylulokinase
MISLGYDIGSSSIKVAAVDCETGAILGTEFFPREEMPIHSPRPGHAEQDPDVWWQCVVEVTRKILAGGRVVPGNIGAIGISYQMHGLVAVDAAMKPVRPAIIWCDSRAVEIGNKAFKSLGEEYCLSHLLNSPGNFTASKLRWVRENEPDVYARIVRVMLPGDYVALRMSGEATTTVTGLSEGIFWNFAENAIDRRLLNEYQIDESLLAPVVPAIGLQGRLTRGAAVELGIPEGIPISYRAGDQPNNALSLNVLQPGEVAATAGTSGVVYGVASSRASDPRSRVNLFAHVNHTVANPRLGVLLCINGTGIFYSWTRRMFGGQDSYAALNEAAAAVPAGSEGLTILPFGNGAERMLDNRNPGARVCGLDLVRHGRGHLVRAAQEGIAFSFQRGMEIMQAMGMRTDMIRAGHANLFLSPIFRRTLATISGATIELYDTDGAAGTARGAAAGAGLYPDLASALASLKKISVEGPHRPDEGVLAESYARWNKELDAILA